MEPEHADAANRRAEFLSHLQSLHTPARFERIVASLSAPKRTGFWSNPLRPADSAALSELLTTLEATPIPGLASMWSVEPAQRETLVRSALCMQGSLYPINPASVWAAAQLAVQPEEEVLDLAAAPGGKTLQLAAAMDNTGRLAAVESVPARFHRMRANLERVGANNVQLYLRDGRSVGRKVGERFDRVLLDAPCSSETRIRLQEPKTYTHWSKRKVGEAARKQKRLLLSAYAALKPGGRLVYCTCAFAREENEAVLEHLLRRQPQARLLDLPAPPVEYDAGDRLPQAQRILPDDLWNGFFLAALEKPGPVNSLG